MLEVYKRFFTDYLAIPAITGRKTESEKFAGAEYTLTIEALMYNGVALQSGTSHYFGQKFSRAYDIKFLNKNNEYEYAYQTSWGVSTRMIGGLIMVHGDDYGLVLPPKIAPTKAVIVPIGTSTKVMDMAKELENKLLSKDITAYIDDSDKSPGFKFASSEVNGIPIRIELGERDLNNNCIYISRRDTREKEEVSLDEDITKYINDLLNDIQNNLLNMAIKRRNELTFEAHNLEEFKNIMDKQYGFVKADWCGDSECEAKIKEIKGTKSRCILEGEKPLTGKCVVCGKEANDLVIWGVQY